MFVVWMIGIIMRLILTKNESSIFLMSVPLIINIILVSASELI